MTNEKFTLRGTSWANGVTQPVCSTSYFRVDNLQLAEVTDPSFSETYMLAHFHNLTCHRIDVVNGSFAFSPSSTSTLLTGSADVWCQTQFNFSSYHGNFHAAFKLSPSAAVIDSQTQPEKKLPYSSECSVSSATVGECHVDLRVTQLSLDPPHSALDALLESVRARIEEDAEKYVCKVAVPRYIELLMNKTLVAPAAPPPAINNSLSLLEWPLVNVMRHVAAAWPVDSVIRPTVDALPDGSTLRLSAQLSQIYKTVKYAVNVHPAEPTESPLNRSTIDQQRTPTVSRGQEDNSVLVNTLNSLIMSSESEIDVQLAKRGFPGVLRNLTGNLTLQPFTQISIDVSIPDLQCDDATRRYHCHIPSTGGLLLSNLRLSSSKSLWLERHSDLSQIVTNVVAPAALPHLQSALDHAVTRWATVDSAVNTSVPTNRVYLPMLEPGVWSSVPPTWGMVVFLTTALALVGGFLRLSSVRHAKRPVCWRCTSSAHEGSEEGEREAAENAPTLAVPDRRTDGNWDPLSPRHVLCEDAFLLVTTALCAGCFLWSNCTTVANVIVGEELELYSFSLMQSVTKLWDSGFHFMAVCAFFFSGIFPYVRLAGILLLTILLQRPESATLRVIEISGKLSFLDTFLMLIMVAGLTDGYTVTVRMHASFYVSLAAKVGSLAVGNYATTLWRHGTTLRSEVRDETQSLASGVGSDETRPLLQETDASAHENENLPNDGYVHSTAEPSSRGAQIVSVIWRFLGSIQWCVAVPSGVMMILLTRPAWRGSCITYVSGGLVLLARQEHHNVSLKNLSDVDPICGILLVVTLLLAPCVYAFTYPRFQFLSSWCAMDVFLLACVAGLLKLDELVQFAIGDDYAGIYTAGATLQFPIFLLFAASLIQWALAIACIQRVAVDSKFKHCFSSFVNCHSSIESGAENTQSLTATEESVANEPTLRSQSTETPVT